MEKNEEKLLGCPFCGHRFEGVNQNTPYVKLKCPECRTRMIIEQTKDKEITIRFRLSFFWPLLRFGRT